MKKKLNVLLCAMLATGSLTGCSGGATTTTTAAATSAQPSPEETTATAPESTNAESSAETHVSFDETIRLIVPYDAGGGVYNAATIVASAASEKLGTTIEVVCMSGNGGQEGVEYVYNQPSDGYTLLATDYGPLISTAIEEDVIYELNDFTPIVEMTQVIPTFFVKSDSPYNSIEELLSAAKEAPGTISVAHGKYHSVPHLPLILLEQLAEVDFNEVATSGGSEALAFTLGGNVDVGASVPSTIAGSVESGELRVLGVASDERAEEFPDAPTLKELGYDVSMPAWYTIFAKSDVPEEIRSALESAMTEAILSEDTQETAAGANVTLTGLGSVESAERYQNSITSLEQILGEE